MTFPYRSLSSGISATISPVSLTEPFSEGSVQRLFALTAADPGEVGYFRDAGKLEAFAKLNAV